MSDSSPPQLGYRIGEHEVRHGLSLAPMAGNTNLAYRRLCRRFGAELTTTEMASSLALKYGDEKSLTLLERGADETPVAAQVFGADPEILRVAAAEIEKRGFDILDLNIGCPVPKITGCGGGSALLREPDLAARCIEAMIAGTSLPVTVKMRAGWSDDNKNAAAFAKKMEEAGAQTITVHGRTREQRYTGHADLDLIRSVKESVSVPVIGNGDVTDLASAARMAATGVDGIAIGRGALGQPWIFAQIHAWLDGEPIPESPDVAARAALMLELGHGVVELYGEYRGMRIMRRLATDFFRGCQGAPAMRQRSNKLETLEDLQTLAEALASGERLEPLASN